MSQEEVGTRNSEAVDNGSGSAPTATVETVGSVEPNQPSDFLGIVDANSKNIIAVMNEMNKNIIDYISDNNKVIMGNIEDLIKNSNGTNFNINTNEFIDSNYSEVFKSIFDKIDDNNRNVVGILNEIGSSIVKLMDESGGNISASAHDSSDVMEIKSESRRDSIEKFLEEVREKLSVERRPIGSVVTHLNQRLDSVDARIQQIEPQVNGLEERFHAAIAANNISLMSVLEASSKALVDLIGQSNLDLARSLTEREQLQLETLVRRKVSFPFHPIAEGVALPDVVNPMSLTEAMNRLRELAPLNYDNYLTCLDTGTESYSDLPEVSCSTERHPQARLFHDFLQPYLRNVVLDIGCGPQPVPSYLASWPVENIVGIDPISAPEDHPFLFVSGIGEFLPFPDNSFGTVVSGTTLDHYYLLDKGLKEAFRVLEPGGHFVAWITEFEGAPEYDPYTSLVKPFDHEHMYHIDRKWYLPMMQSIGFEVGEVIRFPLPFNYLFMSFRKPL